MKRFRKVLFIALGNTTEPPDALEDAVALAVRNDATLTVLGVLPDPPARQRDLPIPDSNDQLTDVVAAELAYRLDTWIRPFDGNNINARVAVGNPPIAIVQSVIADKHDLLVVTTDASDKSAATIRRLLRLCPCPVWVLRKGHDEGAVLAAIDPDDEPGLNEAILHLAQSQASTLGGQLHVAHAWELYGEAILRASERMPVPALALSSLGAEAEAAHRQAFSDAIAGTGISGQQEHFVNGTPIQAIIGLISLYRIDLLVMGSVGRAGVEGVTVGNTAEQIFAEVDCSVLVLKPEGFRSPVQATFVDQ